MTTRLALAALLLATAAHASENDRLRSGGSSSPPVADGPNHGTSSGRSHSGGHHGGSNYSGGDDGCAVACDAMLSCLNVLDACSVCASAIDGPRPVIVQGEPPPVESDPVRFGLMLSMGRPLTEVASFTPHLDTFVDLPIQPHVALRFAFDHTSLLQAKDGGVWDHIPVDAFRGGLAWDFRHWALAMVAGVRLVDIDLSSPEAPPPNVGLDLGATLSIDQEQWFLDAGLLGTALSGMVAGEATVRAGIASGPWRLGIGWRHLEFFKENDPVSIRYTGPEIAVGLRL